MDESDRTISREEAIRRLNVTDDLAWLENACRVAIDAIGTARSSLAEGEVYKAYRVLDGARFPVIAQLGQRLTGVLEGLSAVVENLPREEML